LALFGEGFVRTWRNHDDGMRTGQIASTKKQSGKRQMADQTTRSGTSERSHAETLRSFSEHTLEATRKRPADFAETSEDKASNLGNEAKKRARQTTDTIKEAVADRKDTGADYVSSLAEAIRRAAREFDNDLPLAGNYMRQAASQIETVAGSMRTADFKASIRNVRSFARRQPTAFLGITALAGFAAVSVLRSSSCLGLSGSSHGSPTADTGYLDN
jgi:hypothetical protein